MIQSSRVTRMMLLTRSALPLLFCISISAQALTFTPKYEAKLFIGTIPPLDCGLSALAVVGAAPGAVANAERAAFVAFCMATSLGENPATGALVPVPLDARVAGSVSLSFICQAGNALPIAPTSVTAGPTQGGMEALFLQGVVNLPTTRDTLVANGGWGFVLSGHPQTPIVEAGFGAFAPGGVLVGRVNTDIWQRINATVACGVDNHGLPTATITRNMSYTVFPSHRLWFYGSAGTPAPGAQVFNAAQGTFATLWSLPVVPAP